MQRRGKQSKLQNLTTADIKQRQSNQSKIYITEILQISICREKENKAKDRELK